MAYIFEVVLTASYYNQQVINVWNYINPAFSPGDDPEASVLLSLLGWSEWNTTIEGDYPADTVAAAFIPCVNPQFLLESVLVRDVYSNVNIAEWVFPPGVAGQSAGLLTGEACSPVVAVGFNTNRVRTDIHRGQKRLSGITESVFDAGGNLNSSVATTRYNPLAEAMSRALDHPTIGKGTYYPAVCKKQRYEVQEDGEPTGRFAYRYYLDPAFQEENTASGVTWSVKPRQRFQVSRQYGKGR